MGLASILADSFTRGHVLGEGAEGDILLGGERTAAGERVDERTALKVAAVYSCVSLVSSSVLQMPCEVCQDTGDGVLRLDRTSRLWELLHDQPNDEMYASQLWEWTVKCLLLRGNAYLYLMRDPLGRVVGLWPLHPRRVTVRRDLITRRKIFEVSAPDSFERVEFYGTADDILHLVGFDYNGIEGKSVIHHQRETIGRALKEDRHAAETLRNHARPGGILSVKGRLDAERRDRLAKQWQAAHGGSKVGGTAVLEEDAEWKAVTMTAADLELIQQRGMTREDIAMAFQVPSDMVIAAGSKSNDLHYSSDESRDLRLVKYGVFPWTTRIKGGLEICQWLPWRYGVTGGRRVVRFNPKPLLLADIKTRYEAHKMGIEAHFLAPDEVRVEEDLEPLGKGFDKPSPLLAKPGVTVPGTGD